MLMPEIPNRDSLEADFARKFGRDARVHMHEFRELLGNPPDLANVPPEFWERMERESERDVYPFLLLIFTTGAAMYHWRGAIANLAGFGFASERSRTFGQQWVESTRSKLEAAQQAISDAIQQGEQAERFADFAGHEPASQQTIPPGGRTRRPVPVRPIEPDEDPVEFARDEWRRILDELFGVNRILQNVEDLTTEARHAGQESAVEATTGLSPDDLWINTGSNVCPICVSLNEKPRSFWSRFFPKGPPTPHSRCKCLVRYALASPQPATTTSP